MTRSAEDVEREVEATRNNLDRTAQAIRDKMTPPQIFEEVVQGLGATGTRMVNGLGDQVRDNPVPFALIGLGLAWLVAGSLRGRDSYAEPRSFVGDSYGGVDPYYGEAEQKRSLRERAAGTLEAAKGRISEAVGSISDTPAAERAQALAGSAIDAAASARRAAETTFNNTLDRDPLIIGALGVVVGAAIGAALPATRLENRYAGPIRDKVVDRSMSLASDGLEGVRHATQAAYTGVKSELTRREEGEPIADKAERVARAAVQSARDELSRPH